MKNEHVARAITQIDYKLIEEANETPSRKGLNGDLLGKLMRYGSVAACLLVVVGAFMLSSLRGPGVLLYGEEITADGRVINEYLPRAISYSVSPAEIATHTIPMELDFKRTTELTVDFGELIVIDGEGNEVHRGKEYRAVGETSLCLSLPESTQRCVIVTDRGYNIVLNQDPTSGLWYVNIEK